MKKIITTIILALLTSPAFADFKFVKEYSEGTQEFLYSVNNEATNNVFNVLVGRDYILINNMIMEVQLSSKTKVILFKFDQNKPRGCRYLPPDTGIAMLDPNCYEWMVENMKAGNKMNINFFSKKEKFLQITLPLKGFTAGYRKLERVNIR